MKVISIILNTPWTLCGLLLGLISVPKKATFRDGAIIITIRSWWWTALFPWMRGVRGTANGSTILLGPNQEPKDLEHELIHIEQHARYPLIYPLLYTIETLRFGYRNNRFEREAYQKAGNIYKTT